MGIAKRENRKEEVVQKPPKIYLHRKNPNGIPEKDPDMMTKEDIIQIIMIDVWAGSRLKGSQITQSIILDLTKTEEDAIPLVIICIMAKKKETEAALLIVARTIKEIVGLISKETENTIGDNLKE